MFSDVLGSQIITIKGDEFGALGVAINNAVVQGLYPSYLSAVDRIVKVDKVYEPDMQKHEEYLKYYRLFAEIRHQLQPTWKTRSDVMQGD